MIEYTRAFLNSQCDKEFVRLMVRRIIDGKLIENRVWQTVDSNIRDKKNTIQKLTYDLTEERETKYLFPRKTTSEKSYVEASWKFASFMIVHELQKVFVDCDITYEFKNIYDIYENVTVNRLIHIDWK